MFRKPASFLSAVFLCALMSAPAYGEVRVQSFIGVSELLENGEWRDLQAGEIIERGAQLRTDGESRLQLALADKSFIRLLAKTSSTIAESEIIKSVHNLKISLEKGTLVLSSSGDKVKTDVKTPGDYTVSGDGLFSVGIKEKEHIRVSVLKGRVCVHDKEKKYCAKTKQELFFDKENLPGKPVKISEESLRMWKEEKFLAPLDEDSLFLNVLRPKEGRCYDQSGVSVVGSTLPGAIVHVNGKKLEVGKDGDFSGNITLFEGENALNITAVSQDGETISVIHTICLDSTPPLLTVSQPVDNFEPSFMGNCNASECLIQIFGLTEPGVLLIINGMDVSRFIEDDGSFLIQDFPVRLTESVLKIQAQDSLGRSTYEILHVQSPTDSDGDNIPDSLDPCPLDALNQCM